MRTGKRRSATVIISRGLPNGPGLGFENSDNLCRGYNPSWFPECKLDNAPRTTKEISSQQAAHPYGHREFQQTRSSYRSRLVA
jgi:hypothetical protein